MKYADLLKDGEAADRDLERAEKDIKYYQLRGQIHETYGYYYRRLAYWPLAFALALFESMQNFCRQIKRNKKT
jgi:hypothetical protein